MPGYQLMPHLSGNLMISLNNIWSQAGRAFHIISQNMEDLMVPKNSTSDSDVTREAFKDQCTLVERDLCTGPCAHCAALMKASTGSFNRWRRKRVGSEWRVMEGFMRGSNLRRGQGENKRGKCVLIGVHVIVSVQGRRGVSSKRRWLQQPAALSQAAQSSPNLSEIFFNPQPLSCLPQGLCTGRVSVFGKPDTRWKWTWFSLTFQKYTREAEFKCVIASACTCMCALEGACK